MRARSSHVPLRAGRCPRTRSARSKAVGRSEINPNPESVSLKAAWNSQSSPPQAQIARITRPLHVVQQNPDPTLREFYRSARNHKPLRGVISLTVRGKPQVGQAFSLRSRDWSSESNAGSFRLKARLTVGIGPLERGTPRELAAVGPRGSGVLFGPQLLGANHYFFARFWTVVVQVELQGGGQGWRPMLDEP